MRWGHSRKSLNSVWNIAKVFPEKVTFNLVLEREVVSRQRRRHMSSIKAKM